MRRLAHLLLASTVAGLPALGLLAPTGCGPTVPMSTVSVPDDDPEMTQAIAAAVATMPKLDAALAARSARCYVKAAFPTPDGDDEVCWILVEEKRDGVYHGTLDVIPERLPGLSAGSPVRVPSADAIDWMIVVRGMPVDGNHTLRVLLPRMNAEQAAAAKRAMGWE